VPGMDKFKIALAVCMILMSSSAYAINLGSAEKIRYDEITSFESAEFKLIFWNNENTTYDVKLTASDYPKDWAVIIDPSEFLLNRNTGDEYISLPYTSENVKAKVVKIFVKPTEKSLTGIYKISVKSQTGLPGPAEGGMNIMSEKIFTFEVNLTGLTDTIDVEVQNSTANYPHTDTANEPQLSKETANRDDKEGFYAVIIILVAAISIIIYKKYK
jgi:hypothetical protein